MSQPTIEQQNATQQASDTQANGAAAQPTATEGTRGAADDPGDDLDKWKALARKHEARASANADKAKRYDELEEANKTELQKANDRAAAAEKKAADAERKAFAASKGIPASLIRGTTEQEWEASAAEALAWKGEQPKAAVAPPAKGQGNVGTDVRDTKDRSADEIVSAALQR